MMERKTIVFDLDDTIINEIDFLISAFREISDYVDNNNKLLFDQMFHWYKEKNNVFENLIKQYEWIKIQDLKNMYRNHIPNLKLDQGIELLFNELKAKNHFLGLITDGFSITQRNKIKALGIETFFDLIIISEEFGSEKPDENNFRVFHQFKTKEYFYIADNISKDFVTPNKLSWTTICILDNGKNIHKQDFNKELIYLPQKIIKNLTDFNI